MNKLLVAIDFSESSKKALQYAIGLANDLHASLMVSHVAEPQPFLAQSPGDLLDEANRELDKNIRSRLNTLVQELRSGYRDDPFPVVEYEVRHGRVVDQLLNVVSEHACDMIILGTHGKSGIRDIVFGSHTEQTLQKAKKPVLVVPPNCRYEKPKALAYAVDYRDFDDEDIAQLLKVKHALKASLSLVHVEQEENKIPNDRDFQNFADTVAQLAKEEKVAYRFIDGEDVFSALNTYVQEESIGMLAMKHRHDNFLDRVFNRSLTNLMSYYTIVPLLVFED